MLIECPKCEYQQQYTAGSVDIECSECHTVIRSAELLTRKYRILHSDARTIVLERIDFLMRETGTEFKETIVIAMCEREDGYLPDWTPQEELLAAIFNWSQFEMGMARSQRLRGPAGPPVGLTEAEITQLLTPLSARDAQIVRVRFFGTGSDEPLGVIEAARHFGMRDGELRQHVDRVIRRLRHLPPEPT